MKFFTNKETNKKILIALIIVMLFNFTSPTVSRADIGGTLFTPIASLLEAIGDLLIKGLQKIFLGDGKIATDALR